VSMSGIEGGAAFTLEEDGGLRFLEASAGRPLMSRVDDAALVVEACLSGGVDRVLLYAENLTRGFFDLSSGEAGCILQKLRNYRIRLAVVVCVPQRVRVSSHFGELIAEENRREHFRLFESRQAAREWLIQGDKSHVPPNR